VSTVYDATQQRFLRPSDAGRMRRNQRRIQVQRLLGALGHVLVVGTVITIAVWLYLRAQSDTRFALKSIEVTGAVHTPRAAVDAVTQAYAGANLFRLDIARLQREVGRLPWVSRVEVEKKLPATLHINIIERSPVALVNDGGRLAYVDEHGVAFAGLSPSIGDSDLPVIRDARGSELARAVALVRDLRARDAEVYSRISEVRPVAPRGFALFDRELGAEVLANGDDLSAKWRDLYAVVRAERLGKGDVAYADLRFAGRIVVKPLRPILTAAAPAQPTAPVQITN
jgi:cell division protein FtsQ